MQSKEKTKSSDDSSLVAALQIGSDKGYEQLYDRYASLMFGVIRRVVGVGEDAENLLQDSFIKIWRNIETYDASKGKFSTWILNIARNTAIDFYRSKAFSQQRKNQNLENLVEPKMILGNTITPTDTIGLLEMVAAITPVNRQIIEWLYFDGFTQADIAQTFGLPLGTVKTRTRNGLKELRQYFDLNDWQKNTYGYKLNCTWFKRL